MKCPGLNVTGGCSAYLVIITMSACWLTNRVLALIPPGTRTGGRIIIGDTVVRICCKHLLSVVGHSSGGINVGVTHRITGTAPGVLFRVCCRCMCFVLLKLCLAVGSRICIIAGALEICMIGRGSSLSTGGTSILFALVTLCSTLVCGIRMSSRAFCKHLISIWPFCICDGMPVDICSPLVSAFRCALLLRFGTWQCCGNNSADPEILYARISGT
jgi:hypothetical protein